MSAVALLPLEKGQKVDITKNNPGLKKLMIGLGWDTQIDLDAFVYALKGGKLFAQAPQSVLYFANKNLFNGGIVHSGDNLTGVGDGDDETITVDLSLLPDDLDEMKFYVNIYNQPTKTFGSVSGSFIRAYDDNNNELFRYDLQEDFSSNNAVEFGRLYKHNGEWKFEATGKGKNGDINTLMAEYL